MKLSRTFAIPISMLEEQLERVVTCGYLLCRIADTVEDRADLSLTIRNDLYEKLLSVLERGADPSVFTEAYRRVQEENDEGALAGGLGRVLAVLQESDPQAQEACKRWVAELIRGMAIYSQRPQGNDGVMALNSVADLDRYCYFVAGTVGQMLTALFLLQMPKLSAERRLRLRANAEAFGTGLQLVNIIKDMSEDLQRQVSFIPHVLWSAQGLTATDMVNPKKRAAAHRAVAQVFDRAREDLDRAFDYVLALPPEQKAIRLFCLVPLWLAVATLGLARGNDDLFITGRKVKISRETVAFLIEQCVQLCHDDEGLQRAYRELWTVNLSPRTREDRLG